MKRRVIFALILMGFTSLVVQVLLIREFLITFYGNELTIGLVLACWIISEALGSGVASRVVNKARSPLAIYAFLQTAISIYLPLGIFLIRGIKNILPLTPGEATGILPLLGASLVIIGPLSILDGMQFPFGCRIYGQHQKRAGQTEQTPGRVYILEAVGFILAGPVFTYIFLTRLHSFQIALLIGTINLISALWLILADSIASLRGAPPLAGRRSNLTSCWIASPLTSSMSRARNDGTTLLTFFMTILLALNIYLLSSDASLKLHNYSVAGQWKGRSLIEYKNSIYGNLAVSRAEEQYTFYSDGIPIINIPTPDIMWTEEFVHFGLLSHPNPKTALFLCGGAGGAINEALKHPLNKIDYAELDPLLIELLKKFPKGLTQKELSSPKVHLKITDGVRLVKKTDAKYDVVFINLPSPSTLQLNRYYTKEFFGRIKRLLNPNGQLILSLPGSLSYLNEELQQLNLCILTTLKNTFPEVYVIPGDNNLYISSASDKTLEITPKIFIERLGERNIPTNVLTPFHLEYRLKKYWQDWFYGTIEKVKAKENRNLTPTGVFYGISYWNSLFSPQFRGFFKLLGRLDFFHLIFFLIILLFVIIIGGAVHRAPTLGPAIAVSIATTGFVGMSFDLIFILTYQVLFGYVYHHIALLVTSFMSGLTLGGWLITRNLEKIRRGHLWFLAMEVLLIAFSFGSGLLLPHLNNMDKFEFYPLFFILPAMVGFLVGSEFPLANKLSQRNAGVLYSLDLFGAFFSALLVSIIFIPLFGIFKTCLFLAILKIVGLSLFFQTFKGIGRYKSGHNSYAHYAVK